MVSVSKLKRLIRSKEIQLIIITIAIILFFFIKNPYFLSLGSIRGTMQSMSVTGIMAVGLGVLLISGCVDLSTTVVHLLAGVVCAKLIGTGMPWGFAMLLAVMAGTCIGGVNAFLITKLDMMPFISTLAVSGVVTGLNYSITNVQLIPISVESFGWANYNLFGIFPFSFIIMLLVMLLYGYILKYTQFGRNIYRIGGNMNAARLAGINPVKIRSILYINNAIIASLAGLVLASRMQNGIPSSLTDTQLTAYTAVVLGGISFYGGSGGMKACIIGTVLMSFLNMGLNSLALDASWTTISSGALLLIALIADFFNEQARERALKVKVKPAAINADAEKRADNA